MHNLFGDTDSVDVELTPDSGFKLNHAIQGDTVDSVLRYVNFDSADLLERYRAKFDVSIKDKNLRQQLLTEIENGLHGYTYLEE